MALDSPYAKDLGYLERFIARLEGDAAQLPAARRERALALLAAERGQWREIMALLAGAPVEAEMAPPKPSAPAETRPAEPMASGRFTVGSLMGQP